jgi:hypothetical protein
MCQCVIISLIYYFEEELSDSLKDMLYLVPIYYRGKHIVSGTTLILIALMNAYFL